MKVAVCRFLLVACVLHVFAFGDVAAAFAGSPGQGAQKTSVDDDEAQRMFRQSVALGVPEAELNDLVKRCRDAGFTSGEIRRILSLMTKAKLAGLPHEDLLNKLREGLAKRAPPDAIERAVEAKAQVLRRAKSVADALLTEGRIAPNYSLALKVVADALDAGATPADVLRAVRDNSALGENMPDVRPVFRDMR